MGSSQDKEKNKSSGSDDQCMGNKRMRSIILGGLLAGFTALSFAFYQDQSDASGDNKKNGYLVLLIGCIVIFISAVGAILLNIITCLPVLNKICGVGLFVGGAAFFIGSFMIMAPKCEITFTFGNTTTSIKCTGDLLKQYDAQRTIDFGNGCLAGITAFLLGLDIFMDFLSDETRRLAGNLGNLCIVGFLHMGAYAALATIDLYTQKTKDAYATIAGGSSIFGVVALVYLILAVFSCCTCNVKDSCLFRVLFAVGLCIGGFVASSGYWALSDTPGFNDKAKAYFVGFTVLVGGLCFAWAVDIMFDDIKGAKEGNSKK